MPRTLTPFQEASVAAPSSLPVSQPAQSFPQSSQYQAPQGEGFLSRAAKFVGNAVKDTAVTMARPLVTPFAGFASGIEGLTGKAIPGSQALRDFSGVTDFDLTKASTGKQLAARAIEGAQDLATMGGLPQVGTFLKGAGYGVASALQKQGDQGNNNFGLSEAADVVGSGLLGGVVAKGVETGLNVVKSVAGGTKRVAKDLLDTYKVTNEADKALIESNPEYVKGHFEDFAKAAGQNKEAFGKVLGGKKIAMAEEAVPTILSAKKLAGQAYADLMDPVIQANKDMPIDVKGLKSAINESAKGLLASVGEGSRSEAMDATNTILKEGLKKNASIPDLVNLARRLGEASTSGDDSGRVAYAAKQIVVDELDDLTSGASRQANAFYTDFMDNFKILDPITKGQSLGKLSLTEDMALKDKAANLLWSIDSKTRGGTEQALEKIMEFVGGTNPDVAARAGIDNATLKSAQTLIPRLEGAKLAERLSSSKFEEVGWAPELIKKGISGVVGAATALGGGLKGSQSLTPRLLGENLFNDGFFSKIKAPVSVQKFLSNPMVLDALFRHIYESKNQADKAEHP